MTPTARALRLLLRGREAMSRLYAAGLRRVNVSAEIHTDRAARLASIVASPCLLEPRARTIEQMPLINALCRFAEMAGEQAASDVHNSTH